MHKRQRKRRWVGRITCLNYTDFGVHLFFFLDGVTFFFACACKIFFLIIDVQASIHVLRRIS